MLRLDRRHWMTSLPRGRYLTALVLTAGLALAMIAGGPARAAQPGLRLITKIKVGRDPGGSVVNSPTNTIYAGTYYNSTVSVISGATNTIYVTIANQNGPDPVNLVLKISGTTNKTVARAQRPSRSIRSPIPSTPATSTPGPSPCCKADRQPPRKNQHPAARRGITASQRYRMPTTFFEHVIEVVRVSSPTARACFGTALPGWGERGRAGLRARFASPRSDRLQMIFRRDDEGSVAG